jgi:hypothetical protein
LCVAPSRTTLSLLVVVPLRFAFGTTDAHMQMELSKHLRDYARTIPGKQQLLINAYAKVILFSLFSLIS